MGGDEIGRENEKVLANTEGQCFWVCAGYSSKRNMGFYRESGRPCRGGGWFQVVLFAHLRREGPSQLSKNAVLNVKGVKKKNKKIGEGGGAHPEEKGGSTPEGKKWPKQENAKTKLVCADISRRTKE